MKIKNWFALYIEVLAEAIFPRKKHSIIAQKQSSGMLRGKIQPIQNREHIALLPYNDQSVKHFLYAIKYENHKKSIALASGILLEYIYDEIQEQETLQKMEYALCTIPSTQERRKSGGYNHLHKILNEMHNHILAAELNVQDKRNLLRWTRPVSRQSRLKSQKERFNNVNSAMTITEHLPPNTIYFVIDDITTTGATLTEARRTLVASGADTVITLALAH